MSKIIETWYGEELIHLNNFFHWVHFQFSTEFKLSNMEQLHFEFFLEFSRGSNLFVKI
jgi:hypothetical protein